MKFLLLIVAIAAAVSVVTAISDLSDAVRTALFLNARQWLGADVQVRSNRLPSPEQVDSIAAAGWDATVVTETAGQISCEDRSRFVMAAIKAVEPKIYPLYGTLGVDPPGPLDRFLDEDSAVVSADLLAKLNTPLNGKIRVSGAEFRIIGVVRDEPDRFAVMPLALMRVIVSREGLARTGMLQHGAAAIHRVLVRVPAEVNLDAVTPRLAQMFPGAEVADYRENAAGVAGIEEQATAYFSFLTFMSLAVASLGVGLLMYTHVQQSMESIAIIKLIGGTSRQVLGIYAFQLLAIAAVGSAIGYGAGILAEHAFPGMLRGYLSFPILLRPSWRGAAAGLGMGALLPSLFSLSALLFVRAVRPNILLRRNFITERLRVTSAARIALASAGGLSTIAFSARGSRVLAGQLVVALVAGALVAMGGAALAKTLIRVILKGARRRLSTAVRYGAANFGRPGSLAFSTVFVLGLGVCFVYVAYLLEVSLIAQVLSYSPFHGANLYILNVGEQQEPSVLDSIRAQAGVTRIDLDPFVVLRLQTIRGNPISRTIRRTWFAAVADAQPRVIQIVDGAWWGRDDRVPQVAISRRAASAMRVRIGETLEFANGPELVRVRVAAIHRGLGPDALRYPLVLSPAAVTMARVTYNGAVWAEASALESLQNTLRAAHPTVIVLSRAEVASLMQDTASQVASVLRLISAFGLAGGAVILGASVVAMRYQRELEISVFKVLGATRRQLIQTLCSEFTLIGVAAALLGIALGNTLGAVLGAYAFEDRLETFWSWRAALVTVAAAVAMTNLGGWGAGAAILRRKPNEILRGE